MSKKEKVKNFLIKVVKGTYRVMEELDKFSVDYLERKEEEEERERQNNYEEEARHSDSVRIDEEGRKVIWCNDRWELCETAEETIRRVNRKINSIAEAEFYKSTGIFIDNGRVLTPRTMTIDEEWAERRREAGPLIYEKLEAERFATELEIERDFKSGSISKDEAIDRLRHNERRYNIIVNDYEKEGY